MTAPSATLQQQLAEVEEAAQRERRPVVVQAARMGRHDVLAHLLRVAGSGAGGMSKDGRSAAFLAASSVGHERCLRGLLEASPPSVVADLVRATDGKGRNGLILAASNGRTSCVRLLLQHSPGVQVTHAAGYGGGRNALVAACTLGYAECVELLLQHNPEAQVTLTSMGGNALLWAAMNGHLACVRLLLAHSPQLQRLDRALFYTAYHQARRRQLSGGGGDETPRSCLQCMELLLSKGAMLSAGTPAEEFALVRRVIQDLAARALAPDMANEATAQAVQLRRREATAAVGTRVASAVAYAASHGEVTAGARAGAPVQQERKRTHACGSCDDGARRRRK